MLDYGLLGQGLLPTGWRSAWLAGQYYRLVTGGFLHANLIHVLMNMLALYQLGLLLEGAFGLGPLRGLEMASMGAGALGVMIPAPTRPHGGCVCVVFGLRGFASWRSAPARIDPFSTGLGWTTLDQPGADVHALELHPGGRTRRGGLIGGAVCGYLLLDFGPKHLKQTIVSPSSRPPPSAPPPSWRRSSSPSHLSRSGPPGGGGFVLTI